MDIAMHEALEARVASIDWVNISYLLWCRLLHGLFP